MRLIFAITICAVFISMAIDFDTIESKKLQAEFQQSWIETFPEDQRMSVSEQIKENTK